MNELYAMNYIHVHVVNVNIVKPEGVRDTGPNKCATLF